MSLIDLFFVLCWIGLPIAAGVAFYPVGGLWGAILVGAILFGVLPAISRVIWFCLPSGRGKPTCPRGVCNEPDYKWIYGIGGKPVCRCKCGIKFVADGDDFQILSDDGSVKPFKRWDRKLGWVDAECNDVQCPKRE